MSFFGGLEDYMEAGKECIGPSSFRETEQWLRARLLAYERRLKDAAKLMDTMSCECEYGDTCLRCEVLGHLRREADTVRRPW
jgi:hypothetical protein